METTFTLEEVKAAIWECDSNKAPAPDGINFFFIKKARETIGDDIYGLVDDFYLSGLLPDGINSSFITLFPKVVGANKLKDFKPISLIGCLYKIISKLQANRLKAAMPEIIGEVQHAFIKGRQIIDSVLIAIEIICHLFKEIKVKGLYSQINSTSTKPLIQLFGNILMKSWNVRTGFGVRWRGWIKQCIYTARVSVLVNGSPL